MRLIKTHSCLLMLFVCQVCCIITKAQSQQNNYSRYYIEHFGEDEGLPQNSVNSILPDNNDFLWIATEGGITRFNGNRFLNVPVASNIYYNNLTRVRNFYLKGKDTILAFSAANYQLATIVNNKIVAMEKVDNSKYGLFFLDRHYTIPFPLFLKNVGLKDHGITGAWDIRNGGFYGSQYNKDTFLVLTNDGFTVYDSSGLVNKINLNRDVSNKVLFLRDQVIFLDNDNYLNYYSISGSHRKESLGIAETSRARIFNNDLNNNIFCVVDSVLYMVAISHGKAVIKKILSNLQHPDDLSVIYQKDSNTIVCGTWRNGLYVYKKQYFLTTGPLPDGEADAFYSQTLFPDNETILTGGNKLFRNSQYIGKTKTLLTTGIYTTLKDSKGYYWYTYYDRILRAKEPGVSADTMIRLQGTPQIICEDKQGRIFVSSGNAFGYFFNDRFTALKFTGFNPSLLSFITQDMKGRYLIGTRFGLFILKDIGDTAIHEMPSFKSLDIRFIWSEENGQTWVCTYGNGFFLITKETVISFPESKGRLAYVHSLIEDTRGYFWIPTNNGLFVTSRESLMAYVKNRNEVPFYYQFSKKHGLRTNEFNGGAQPSYLRWPNADISLPSMQGLVRFNPGLINFNFSSSPILVDDIESDSTEILQRDEFDVANNTGNISFSLSSSFWGEKENDLLEYKVLEKNKAFADGLWLPVDASGKINLFSPSHGSYKLVLRKRTGLKANDYLYKTISFNVMPKWYQTKIFLFAALAGIVLIMFSIFFFRRRYYEQANRILKEKVDAATTELQRMNNTLEKKVEERTQAIIKEKDLSQSIINSLPGVFYVFDQDGQYQLWNKNHETVTGYTSAEMRNMHPDKFIEEHKVGLLHQRVEKVFTEGYAELEADFIRKDGSRVPYYFNGILITYNNKPCIMGVGLDISEKQKAEQEKEHANYLLNERIKELTTLYRAGVILQQEERSIVITLHDFVSILPAGWQYPALTVARIKLGEMEFTTPGFRDCPFRQVAHFTTTNGNNGKIEVGYLEECPPEVEGPFLAEERKLIDMLADMLRIHLNKREALDALQKSEANLHTVFDTTDTMYALLNEDFQLIAFNHRSADFSNKHLKKNFEANTNFIDYFPDERKAGVLANIRKVMEGNHVSYEISYSQAGGGLNWYYVRMFPITNPQKLVFGMMMALSDITEKKRMEQEILDQKIQEQKVVIRAILTGEERERNKIGQELHDNVNQILAGTKLYLSRARNNKNGGVDIINESMQLIDSAIEEIRTLSRDKVTPIKKITLEELLQTLIDGLMGPTDTIATLHYQSSDKLIEDDLKLNIYRIIQEQLNNVLKHAMAKNVVISIHAGEKNIRILVTDDGKGFDTTKKRKGIGVSNMINRVESFNGTISVESSFGNGCKTEIILPY